MPNFLEKAIKSGAWPFTEALKIYERFKNNPPKKGYVLFETGYGPSGLPHIGTFCEVARTCFVMEAFKKISDIPTKLICFSDDMDGLRGVPTNIPNQDKIREYLGKPLTSVPDPFGEKESYGHYMNAKLRSFLDRFGFEYEFLSATDCYKSGKFDSLMLKAVEKYDDIMELMLPTFREERKATYSPFMPICPRTGKVLQVPIEKVDRDSGKVFYRDEEGNKVGVRVTGGGCKLQWKPDFGMRWAALDVDYEMYGKDHFSNGEIYSSICRILGGEPPVQFFFELFLDKDGAKISKSKGNSISLDEWLSYAPLESLALFVYQSPSKAKRLFFDVIPKNVDEYLTFVKKYREETDEVKKLSNPAYHIHRGEVPFVETRGLSFALLLNLACACNPEDKSVLWGFIKKYAPESDPSKDIYLDSLAGFAVKYYKDFVEAGKLYLKPEEKHKIILKKIDSLLGEFVESSTAEEIQNAIYAVGREAGYENLRDFFKELYQILLGSDEGPRMGSFIKLFGLKETRKLIEKVLSE